MPTKVTNKKSLLPVQDFNTWCLQFESEEQMLDAMSALAIVRAIERRAGKLESMVGTIVASGDVDQVKLYQQRVNLLARCSKAVSSIKSKHDDLINTARQGFAGKDFLAGVPTFRKPPDPDKPRGRKPNPVAEIPTEVANF